MKKMILLGFLFFGASGIYASNDVATDDLEDNFLSQINVDVSNNALFDAIDKNDIAQVRQLISSGQVDVNARDRYYGNTALIEAAGSSEDIIKILLAAGVDPNKQNKWKETALREVFRFYPPALDNISLLLQAGADPNRQDLYGDTALMIACRDYAYRGSMSEKEASLESIALLLQAGADPNITNDNQETALDVIQTAMAQHPEKRESYEPGELLLRMCAEYRRINGVATNIAPPDYIKAELKMFRGAEDEILSEKDYEELVQEAEKNQIDYLYQQMYPAYLVFILGDSGPLIRFFCDEIYSKPGLLGVLEGDVFRSKEFLKRSLQALHEDVAIFGQFLDKQSDKVKLDALIQQI